MNDHILHQPLELSVPEKDIDTVRRCVIRALGNLGHNRRPSVGNGMAVFTFDSQMELAAAESIVRQVFAEEIERAEDPIWSEWKLV